MPQQYSRESGATPQDRGLISGADREAQALAELSKQKSEPSHSSSEQTPETLSSPMDQDAAKGNQVDIIV